MNLKILAMAATQARGLAIDAVHTAGIGHLGLPLGAAELGAVLYGHDLRIDPDDPKWINRDRFILSAGHGSMFLYAWLHISGFDIPMAQIRNFRQLHSRTPGHPEYGDTPGVEATTGPLGQGVGNAVGAAVAAKMAAVRFNTAKHRIFDHHVFCLVGDGCLQEGVTAEASAFAGHFGLDNLILIFDSNEVTLDAMAEATQSEDTAARYEAYGFDVATIDGYDMGAFAAALQTARENDNGRPKFIIAQTLIGKGIPEVAGTSKAHGESGVAFAEEARRSLGLPEKHFYVSDEVYAYFAGRKDALREANGEWGATLTAWRTANPKRAELLDKAMRREVPADLLDRIPEFTPESNLATRVAGSEVLQPLADAVPMLISGSADLHGSTKNYIESSDDFTRHNRTGRNIRFGIREHAMGAIVNGFGYYGLFHASGATFLVFSDYMRPSLRLAALAKLSIFHIFTHDSVGVGEDGPTHQPVETTSALRCIPNLDVIRPADPEETAGAFVAALQRQDGPTAIVLTRQNVPTLNSIPVSERRQGTLEGGYVARQESGDLDLIILASGSELQHALSAADELGSGTRVVSLPCFERFDRQSSNYRESVLPAACRRRVAIEAGVTGLWYRYVGLDGRVVGVNRFGLSAPGALVLTELGMHPESILAAVQNLP